MYMNKYPESANICDLFFISVCKTGHLTALWNENVSKYKIERKSVFHISVKSHVFHFKYTDISSILYLDTFSVHLSVKFHVTIVSTQILVQS